MKTCFAFALLLAFGSAQGQTTHFQVGKTCGTATVVCDKQLFTVQSTRNGTRDNTGDVARANSPGCFDLARRQTVYIQFLVKQSGTLEFTIDPIDKGNGAPPRNRQHSEYDWALYRKSACVADSIPNWNGSLECNFFDNGQTSSPFIQTGMKCLTGDTSVDKYIAPGDQQPFTRCITVNKGEEYILLIDNFSANDTGFTITWGGTFDIAPPQQYGVLDTANVPLNEPVSFCCAPCRFSFVDSTNCPGVYDWNFGNGQTASNTTNPPTQTFSYGTFNVVQTVTTNDNCVYVYSEPVTCQPPAGFRIPDAFSPNGDGYNDTFKGEGQGIDQFAFRIFNRWGEKVFETKDPNEAWNGGYNNDLNSMSPSGVYLWTVNLTYLDKSGLDLAGSVTLIDGKQ